MGAEGFSGDVVYQGYDELLGEPGVNIHIYGSSDAAIPKWDTLLWLQKRETKPANARSVQRIVYWSKAKVMIESLWAALQICQLRNKLR